MNLMCRVLKVSRSGYYAWTRRPESRRATRRKQLVGIIRQAHADSRLLYGSPRVHATLLGSGQRCCLNTVARLMQENGLRAKSRRTFRVTTDSAHDLPVAENLLARNFAATAPNQKWAADITYVSTREGWLYLAAVVDLHSRQLVGWAMMDRMTAALPLQALQMAIQHRQPPAGLIHHSDRGSQYASHAYRDVLNTHGFVASMSRKGDCYDNAVMESFFATLKKELIHQRDFQTRTEATNAIFEYVEVYYNRQRKHSTLGFVSPADYELAAVSVS